MAIRILNVLQIQQLEASDSEFDHNALALIKSYTDEAKKSKDNTRTTLAELLKAHAASDTPLHADLPYNLVCM